jgi:hypothetical protein
MTDTQIVGICASILSIIAAILCAMRLHNWRHPILFVGICSLLMLPALAAKKNTPSPTRGGIDVGELWLTEYRRLKSGKETELPRGMPKSRSQDRQADSSDL